MTRSTQTGFSLIELALVIAIAGSLATLVAPSYHVYLQRSQVSEGFNLADGWKVEIAEYYAVNGTWPSQSDLTASVQPSGQYVSDISIANGVIQITYGGPQVPANLMGAVLSLVPYTDANNDVLWQCGLAPVPAGQIAVGAVPVPTTVAPQMLPAGCHS
jgi:type IV pilus assembly protein PilA